MMKSDPNANKSLAKTNNTNTTGNKNASNGAGGGEGMLGKFYVDDEGYV